MNCSVQLMIAHHMADVLAKEALDALAEFLDAIDVALLHPPGAIGCVRLSAARTS